MTTPVPVEVLLVEDNPGDVRLTREALRDGKVRKESLQSRLPIDPLPCRLAFVFHDAA